MESVATARMTEEDYKLRGTLLEYTYHRGAHVYSRYVNGSANYFDPDTLEHINMADVVRRIGTRETKDGAEV